jgi:hypothetical protein
VADWLDPEEQAARQNSAESKAKFRIPELRSTDASKYGRRLLLRKRQLPALCGADQRSAPGPNGRSE